MGSGSGSCGPGGRQFTPQDMNSWLEKVWGLEFDDDVFQNRASSYVKPFIQQRGSRKMFVDMIEVRAVVS